MCVSGNILVTTRNRELRNYSAKDGDANVTGMDHEDETNLLLHLALGRKRATQNKALADNRTGTFFHFYFFRTFSTSKHDDRTRLVSALAVSQAGAFTSIATCH